MINKKQSWLIENVVSPYGLAMVSYALFLLSCLIPPAVYHRYMDEPDFMFLDSTTVLFYTLCVAAFLFGMWFFETITPPAPVIERKLEVRFSPAVFLMMPLVLGVSLSVLSSILLVKNNPLVIPILLAQRGSTLKVDDGSGIQLEGTLNITVFFLTGIVWWVAWRFRQLGVRGWSRRTVGFGLTLAVFAEFISSSLNLIRHPLIVVITGMAVLYVLGKTFAGRMRWSLIAKAGVVFFAGGALFFFIVESLRGGSAEAFTDAFVGYTIASYNRLAALLQGKMHLEYTGRGIYFSNFIAYNHTFNRVIPFARIMNIPEYFNWWRSVFASVGRAGLDARLILFGTFGEIYAEIGWFAPVLVFGYGLLYGLMWRWMRMGNLVAILLYPYFAYCILFWFSTNNLFDQDAAALLIDAIVLGAYEYLCIRRRELLVPVSQFG